MGFRFCTPYIGSSLRGEVLILRAERVETLEGSAGLEEDFVVLVGFLFGCETTETSLPFRRDRTTGVLSSSDSEEESLESLLSSELLLLLFSESELDFELEFDGAEVCLTAFLE